jgi:hypothetical protein
MVWVAGGGCCWGYDGVDGWWEFVIAIRSYCFIRKYEFVGCLVCCVGILHSFY